MGTELSNQAGMLVGTQNTFLMHTSCAHTQHTLAFIYRLMETYKHICYLQTLEH